MVTNRRTVQIRRIYEDPTPNDGTRDELTQPDRAAALSHLRELADHNDLTLLTATKNTGISEAAVLADLIAHPNKSAEQ